MPVGFDNSKQRTLPLDKRNKHYRFMLNETMEEYYEKLHGVKMGVMCEIPIRKGKFIADDNSTSASMLRKITNEDTISGNYKGNTFVIEYDDNTPEQTKIFKAEAEATLNKLTTNNTVHMYLYILEAANLPPKDNFSNSDAYIVIKTGSQKIDYEDEHIDDDPNPQFFKKIHLILKFPIDSVVNIEIWDYDPVLAD